MWTDRRNGQFLGAQLLDIECIAQQRLRISVIAVDLFEAASGAVGAVGLLTGFMNIPERVLSGTPFADFTVPALLLGFVVGGSALVAALIAIFGPRSIDALTSVGAGCITVGWLSVEIAMIGLGSWAQVAWMLVGLVMIGLAGLLWRAEAHSRGTTTRRVAV